MFEVGDVALEVPAQRGVYRHQRPREGRPPALLEPVRCTRSTQPLVWGELSNALVFFCSPRHGRMCMVYVVRRTNIYLPDEQVRALKRLGAQRGTPVSELIREAVAAWLRAKRVRVVAEDESRRRFRSLLQRRRKVAASLKLGEDEVQADVARAIGGVPRTRPARRR